MGCIVYNDRNIRGRTWPDMPVLVFERNYGPLVSCAKDDLVIFYAARTTHNGGDYYAVGTVGRVYSSAGDGHLTASLSEFSRFDSPVTAFASEGAYESVLIGRNWRSMVQRTVRAIPDAEALAMLDAASRVPAPSASGGFGEESSPFLADHRDKELVVRARRWIGLRQETREAYGHRCSFTRCKQRAQDGEIEAECCHIWPVSEGGPDVVSNTLLLGRTMHWAFDHHLISLNDDFSFLVTDRLAPEYRRMLNPDGYARVPADGILQPSREFLRRHRHKMKATRS